LLLLL
jgi:uncharacterized protein with WD repeat